MNIEDAGMSAGGGIIGAILTFLGIKQRMDRHDKEFDDFKARVTFKDICDVRHSAIDHRFDALEKKLDIIIEKLK